MPRQARIAPAGMVYHVMNRTAGKFVMLRKEEDFAAFQRILLEAYQREPLRILGYCLMGTHWHLVVWPRQEGQMSRFFRWLTLTHAVRWRVAHHSVGSGHLYRGRFKAFAVQRSQRLLEVLRYVERNALSAGLVKRAEDWQWGSLWARDHGEEALRAMLCDWPVPRPRDWVRQVNEPAEENELASLEVSEQRERPYGDEGWVRRTVAHLGLEHTVRREGRPSRRPQETR